jgi:molecular chaperone GrpE
MEPPRKAGQPGSAKSRRPAGAPDTPPGPAGVPAEGRPGANPAEPDAEASEEQSQSFESERARAEDSAGIDSRAEDSAGIDSRAEDSAGVDSQEAARVDADLDELIETRKERDEYLELARRTKADFENYRRRAARDTQEAERRGKSALARDLLPALDNLERALRASGTDPESARDEGANAEDGGGLAHGVRLTYHDLRGTLERAGVESYDPKGERFDPTLHEALATRAEEGTEAGIVLETVEKGYRLDGQVLRPARVVVSE